ncbi:MAG: metallophosphoesterase family protein [Desulfitobacteriaceae bacterium]
MRLGIISDIHANYEALDRVLAALNEEKVDQVICLGDLVDFGPSPREVLHRIQKESITVVKGNHDAAVIQYDSTIFQYKSPAEQQYVENSLAGTLHCLTQGDIDYLAALPESWELEIEGSRILFAHGIPDFNGYPTIGQIEEFLVSGSWQYVFWGHTHKPVLLTYKNKMAINVGSVGKPKHGNALAAFCLADIVAGQLTSLNFKYVPYEVEKVCAKIVECGFPSETIEGLRTGRSFRDSHK